MAEKTSSELWSSSTRVARAGSVEKSIEWQEKQSTPLKGASRISVEVPALMLLPIPAAEFVHLAQIARLDNEYPGCHGDW